MAQVTAFGKLITLKSVLFLGIIILLIFLLWVFILRVPNNNLFIVPPYCVVHAGYLCTNITINIGGQLSVTVAQTIGNTLYNVAFACIIPPYAGALPSINEYYSLSNTGNPDALHIAGISLTPNIMAHLNDWPCYNSRNGNLLKNLSAGTTVSGEVWISYTNNSGLISTSNPRINQAWL